MPQLDTLTYFSQYIWLVITFVSVYYFVIEFIIPSTASALKLRSKLNSFKLLKNRQVMNQDPPKGRFVGFSIHSSIFHLNSAKGHLIESNVQCECWSSTTVIDHDFSLVQASKGLRAGSTYQQMQCLLAKKKLIMTLLIPFRLIEL